MAPLSGVPTPEPPFWCVQMGDNHYFYERKDGWGMYGDLHSQSGNHVEFWNRDTGCRVYFYGTFIVNYQPE